jgi:phosphatidylglycerophosphatase C
MTADDESPSRVVVAFDFDGTLTASDSLLPFLVRLRGAPAVAAALAHGARRARRGRSDMKEVVLGRLLRGLDAEAVDEVAERYAEHLLRRRVRPEMRVVIDRHRTQGHVLVLVSASLEAYLSHVGRELGFDAVLATRLEVGEGGLLTGRLSGGNVRGDEKARLLRAWLGGDACVLHVYGDSSGDRAMLAMAHRAVVVRRGRIRRQVDTHPSA